MRRETRPAYQRKVRASIDNGFIYNLRVPTDAVSGELYTIKVRPFGTSMHAVLRI